MTENSAPASANEGRPLITPKEALHELERLADFERRRGVRYWWDGVLAESLRDLVRDVSPAKPGRSVAKGAGATPGAARSTPLPKPGALSGGVPPAGHPASMSASASEHARPHPGDDSGPAASDRSGLERLQRIVGLKPAGSSSTKPASTPATTPPTSTSPNDAPLPRADNSEFPSERQSRGPASSVSERPSPGPASSASERPSPGPPSSASERGKIPEWPVPRLATGRDPDWEERLAAVGRRASGCTACVLSKTRTKVVYGVGSAHVPLVFVGEAPGADEDAQGIPFVGRAGQLLTKIIAAIGLDRDEVYICNVLKCRPPGNRNPEPDEIACCTPFLQEQLAILKPRVICTLGLFASQYLLQNNAPIGKLRGRVFDYHGIPLIPTYHPAALLRNPALKATVWEDVQLVRRTLDA